MEKKIIKSKKLREKYESRFENIGAGKIFHHLHCRNLEKLKEEIELYEESKYREKLIGLIKSYIEDEKKFAKKAKVASYYKNRTVV